MSNVKVYFVDATFHKGYILHFRENTELVKLEDHEAAIANKDAQIMALKSQPLDSSSFCPNHPDLKGVEVCQKYNFQGYEIETQSYKCSDSTCDMTWLSGRQEAKIDKRIGEAKDARVSELESANAGLIEAIVKVRDDFKCGVAEHEVWAINILTETLAKFAKGEK